MTDEQDTPWRGRLRQASRANETATDTLTEQESEAIDGWIPDGSRILTYVRGRAMEADRPLWIVTTTGIMIAALQAANAGQLRARVRWLDASHVCRVDMLAEGTHAVVRLFTTARRFTLVGVDESRATRFVSLARAMLDAEADRRIRGRLMWASA